MKPESRQFHHLGNLSDADFFDRVADGLVALSEHVKDISNDAEAVAANGSERGSGILWALADEEAGKFLILVDAARCPPQPGARRVELLKGCGRHLAKALYAESATLRPADFKELRTIVDRQRGSYFLDGPNDVDWMFQNRHVTGREQTLYVDYQQTDEGLSWYVPTRHGFQPSTPGAVQLVAAMSALGFASAQGLRVVADVWRGFSPVDATRATEADDLIRLTFGGLEDHQLGTKATTDDRRQVLRRWTFPMYGLDLSLDKVDVSELRDVQSRGGARPKP